MKQQKIVAMLLLFIFALSPFNVFADLKVDGIDYVRPQNSSVSFGGNVWHDNFTKGTAVFPLSEAWKTENIGLSNTQPIIIDDLVFVLGDGKVVVLNKYNGSKLAEYNIHSHNITNGNLFVLRSSENQYILIIPSKDGKILSLTANTTRILNENNEKTLNSVNITKNWEWETNNLNTGKNILTNLITSDVTILKDKNIDRIYIGFGTYSGHLIVLDAEKGTALVNANVAFEGSLGSGSGIVYKDFSTIIMPQNKETGNIIGGTVINGVFHLNNNLPEEIHTEGLIAPTAYGVIENPIYNQTVGMLLMQDKNGTILAYDTTNNELLFKIDKYEGYKTMNGFSIAGKYILATLGNNESGKSKIVAIDYERAIQLAQPRSDLKGNGAIIFEEDLGASSYTGAISLTIAEQNKDYYGNIQEIISRELFLVANRNNENSIQMFYLDQYNSANNKPIPVPYGFSIKSAEGVYTSTSALNIPGGITTPLSYAGGYLIFGDGNGNIHAYTAVKENNLALMNFDNSEAELTRGETYIAKVDVINYTGEFQRNVPMEFFIDGSLVHSSLIEIPEDGLTVNFQYTVPKDYKKDTLFIEAKINTKEPRLLIETKYEDNTLPLELKVKEDSIDLEVRDLNSSTPVSANVPQTSSVRIINNSNIKVENALIWYRVAGRNVKTERITLEPRESVVRTYKWTSPNYNTNVTLSVVADPNREIADINRINNTTTKTVKVNKTNSNNSSTCSNGIATGIFGFDYTWLDRIITHHETDEDGNTYTWKEEVWEYEMVNYSETMKTTVAVNTNQQNKDSRGGWEIIPYAQKERIEANKVTRSGYGIELKVDVSYSTSPGWEKLPSPKATPYGSNYINRLRNVKVYANLPNGQRVEMVRTKNSQNNVTFELPEITYTPAGINEKWKGRFFSMPPRTPDGKYPFTIDIVGGGENNLSCTIKDEIYIYGDVFRDTNIQRNR